MLKAVLDSGLPIKRLKLITTRENVRKDETIGVDKIFVTNDAFERLKKCGVLVLPFEAFGNRYGFYKNDIDQLKNGVSLITEMHYTAVPSAREQYDSHSLYIFPGNLDIAISKNAQRNEPFEQREKKEIDMIEQLDFVLSEQGKSMFDEFFQNNYDSDSVTRFLEVIRSAER